MRLARSVLLVLLSALAAACSQDKSFAVVSVFSSVHPIPDVAQLQVTVTIGQNPAYQQLFYPDKPRTSTDLLRLDDTTPLTFSVSFSTTFKGDVTFDVEPLDATHASLGKGTSAPQPLNVGQVTYTTVYVTPSCDPMAPTTSCGTNQTCALVCDVGSLPRTACFSSGSTNPGQACTDTTECLPGSECFEFTACSTAAQPLKTCRKFCNGDGDCDAGSSCNTSVSCASTSTSFHICSRPCDPTGDATLGCAPGLLCFIYAGEVTDCACRDTSRAGAVGGPCATDEDCQPSLMCVNRGNSGTCQTICKLTAPNCSNGTTCTPLTAPVYKVYGACL